MAHLAGLIVTDDDVLRKHVGRLLRTGAVPVSVIDQSTRGEGSAPPDVIVVDIRLDPSSGMSSIERLRAGAPGASIFAVAESNEPDVILNSMRAGANEFFAWPPTDEAFHSAIRRTAARRESVQGARPSSTALVFFGVKGGAGTTTMAVNCGVEIARLTKRPTVIVDLKAGLGEVALFLGVRPRHTLLDAIDNLHRIDRDFLKELVIKHKSGLEILAGSENFERPGGADSGAIEELLRLLTKQYEYMVVDAGSQMGSCAVAALYSADRIFLVANPDVPSVRNAQRILERVRELGACGERVRLLLNRGSEAQPIANKQIETALGHPIHHQFPSDYATVSEALNSGVPLALTGNSEMAEQFDQFTRRIIDPSAEPAPAAKGKGRMGLDRIASLW